MNRKGSALVFFVLAIVLVTVVAGGAVTFLSALARETVMRKETTRAYFAAQAGVVREVHAWLSSHQELDYMRTVAEIQETIPGTNLSYQVGVRQANKLQTTSNWEVSARWRRTAAGQFRDNFDTLHSWRVRNMTPSGQTSVRISGVRIRWWQLSGLGGWIAPPSGAGESKIITLSLNGTVVLSNGSVQSGEYISFGASPFVLSAGAYIGGPSTYIQWSEPDKIPRPIRVTAQWTLEDDPETTTHEALLWEGTWDGRGRVPYNQFCVISTGKAAQPDGSAVVSTVRATIATGVPAYQKTPAYLSWERLDDHQSF